MFCQPKDSFILRTMNKKSFVLFIIFWTMVLNAMAQTSNDCDVPDIVTPVFGDTLNCKKLMDSCKDFKYTLQIDTVNGANMFDMSLGNSENMYYQYGENQSHYIILIEKSTMWVTFFYHNKVSRIIKYDTCTLTELNYDTNGVITEEFHCEYDKPDHCYSKGYSNGVLFAKEYYEPFRYSPVKDSTILNLNMSKKAIPTKTIYYDKDGHVSQEIDWDKERKGIKNNK